MSGATGRVHAVLVEFSRRQPGTNGARRGHFSCRGAQRPASIHLGEETGGPLNKLWRAQLPSLVKAFRGRVLASVPRGSPFHYGRFCACGRSYPADGAGAPAPLPLPFESGGVQDSVSVGACDDPDAVASRGVRRARARATAACVDRTRAMAMRAGLRGTSAARFRGSHVGDGSSDDRCCRGRRGSYCVVAAACREHDIAPRHVPLWDRPPPVGECDGAKRTVAGCAARSARGARSRRSPSRRPGPSLLLRRSPARTRAGEAVHVLSPSTMSLAKEPDDARKWDSRGPRAPSRPLINRR